MALDDANHQNNYDDASHHKCRASRLPTMKQFSLSIALPLVAPMLAGGRA
ncbi:hypothetical protein [Comamonas terrigena]|nr:hypothetical protein [Comamonas terrigena]MDH1500163.1 hypothetical protein [Comamonas terrigena]